MRRPAGQPDREGVQEPPVVAVDAGGLGDVVGPAAERSAQAVATLLPGEIHQTSETNPAELVLLLVHGHPRSDPAKCRLLRLLPPHSAALRRVSLLPHRTEDRRTHPQDAHRRHGRGSSSPPRPSPLSRCTAFSLSSPRCRTSWRPSTASLLRPMASPRPSPSNDEIFRRKSPWW